jgi:hypothetical protein
MEVLQIEEGNEFTASATDIILSFVNLQKFCRNAFLVNPLRYLNCV